MVSTRMEFLVVLTLAALLGQSSSNPVDSLLDPLFGLFGSGDSSSSASADSTASTDSNSVDQGDKGFSASLDAGAANSFAIDKNLHVPDITGKTGGLDANLALAGADSIALSKGIGKSKNKKLADQVIILPTPRPTPYAGPVIVEEHPAYARPGPPRPHPVYMHGPPHPMPVNYQHEEPYNVHDIGSRPGPAQYY